MILVIAEQKDGKLNRASWEAITAAQQLAGGSMPIKVAVAGQGLTAVTAELAQAAVAEVIAVDHAALAHYTPDAFVQAFEVRSAGVEGGARRYNAALQRIDQCIALRGAQQASFNAALAR